MKQLVVFLPTDWWKARKSSSDTEGLPTHPGIVKTTARISRESRWCLSPIRIPSRLWPKYSCRNDTSGLEIAEKLPCFHEDPPSTREADIMRRAVCFLSHQNREGFTDKSSIKWNNSPRRSKGEVYTYHHPSVGLV